MSIQEEILKQGRLLLAEILAAGVSAAEEVREEMLDKIFALVEDYGDDQVVLEEVAVQLPLVAQNLGLVVPEATLRTLLGGLQVLLGLLRGEFLAGLTAVIQALREK